MTGPKSARRTSCTLLDSSARLTWKQTRRSAPTNYPFVAFWYSGHTADEKECASQTPLLNMQSQWEQDQALAAKLQEQEYAPRQSRSARVSGRGRGKGRARGGAVKTEDGAVKTEDGAVKEEGGVKEEDDEEYEEGDESEKEDGGVQLV
eukprot:1249194-Rhodomonas_salina.1